MHSEQSSVAFLAPASGAHRVSLLGDQRGVTTVEYVVLLVLVASVAVGAWRLFGTTVRGGLEKGMGEVDVVVETADLALAANDPGDLGGSAGPGAVPSANSAAVVVSGSAPQALQMKMAPGALKAPEGLGSTRQALSASPAGATVGGVMGGASSIGATPKPPGGVTGGGVVGGAAGGATPKTPVKGDPAATPKPVKGEPGTTPKT